MNYTLGDKRLIKGEKSGTCKTDRAGLMLFLFYVAMNFIILRLSIAPIAKCYLTIGVLGILAVAFTILTILKIRRNNELDLILGLFVLLMLLSIGFQVQTLLELARI